MDDTVVGLGKGSLVWYRQDKATWLLAEIKDASDGSISIQLSQSGKAVDALQDGQGQLVPANPALQQAIADLTQLSYLNEPSILDNLTQRYKQDTIYTNAGPVLIAVNPCRNLPLYTDQVQHDYKIGAFEAVNKLAPHVYLVAGAAFRNMVRQNRSQSLVINGESGAGKTETTKKAMQFLAALAGSQSRDHETPVEKQVLETNPILEAFGNAKTLRNHNSSRFGKLIEIHFNKTNHICGARIRTYLLEKSRVVHQLKGERSFHIFYQLVRGAGKDKALKAELKLPNKPSEFYYLSKSGCMDIDGVDDAKEYAEVMQALMDIGVRQEDITTLLRTLSGILWLGNLKIEAVHANDSSRIKADAALSNASELLGLEQGALVHAITHKEIKTRDEVIIKPLTAQEAGDARDALAKALYSGVFDWIVTRCNAKLDMGKKGSGNFIAILDIYGFEQFQVNSFEQLCINYANERLQQQFTRHLFTLEQEEYQSEGIDWTKVEWVDNQACVDVIESQAAKRLGVLAVLDSQCKFPAASDDTFMNALKDQLAGNNHFAVHPRKQDEFLVTHYAGDVNYSTAGFLDKNKDMLNIDLVKLVQTSDSPLVQEIGDKADAEMEGKRGGQTVSSRFTGQLRELVADLDKTGLHFVRCIKPNAALLPGQLSTELVLQQLRCCGVLEVARVSRAGYPTRYRHGDFVSRYKILLPREQQDIVLASEQQTRAAVLQLLAVFKVPDGQYEMGRTKVFFKPGVLGYVEDTWAKMHTSVLKLQAYTRMHQARQRFQRTRAAALLYQSGWRAREIRLTFGKILREHKAAVAIQRSYRRHAAQQQYQHVRSATRTIQAGWRRHKLEQRVGARVAVREARERAEFEAREAVRRREEGFDALKDEYGIKELSEVKAALACYAALRGELDSRDPEEVAEALSLLAVVRRTTGTHHGTDLSPQQLKQALLLSAACQDTLGAGVDEQQLQDALAAAAVCKQLLGTCDPARVQAMLQTGAVCASELGDSADPKELHDNLALAETARQHLGGACHPQQLEVALSFARQCHEQLGGDCDAFQVQSALQLAAVCQQQMGTECDEQQLQAALQAARICMQEAAGVEAEELRQRLLLAESARQQLGGLDEQQLAQSLAAAAACKQQLGELSTQELQDALAAAAACREQVGAWDLQQLQQQLQLGAAVLEQLEGGLQELQEALAAAEVCRQQAGSLDTQQLQQRLAVAAAAEQQLGTLSEAEVSAALSAALVCKEAVGSLDEALLRQHLAVAAAASKELGTCDAAEVQQALATAHLCKDRLGSLDQKQLQRHLSLAEAASKVSGADVDEQQVQAAMATAALCEQLLGSRDQDELQAALGAAAVCKEQLGAWDQQQLQAALGAAAVCKQELGAWDQQQLQKALGAAAVCKKELQSWDPEQLQQALGAAALCRIELQSWDPEQLQQALGAAAVCKQELKSWDPEQLQARLQLADTAAQQLSEGSDQLQQLQAALAAAAVCKAQLGSYDSEQLQEQLATAAACKQEMGPHGTVEQVQQHLSAGKVVVQQLNGSSIDHTFLKLVLQLGHACQQAGLEQPAQLNGKLQLASAAAGASSPEDVAAALALQQVVLKAAGPAATHQQVAAALELQNAAEDQNIKDAASLQAALAEAASAAANAAAAAAAAKTQEEDSSLPANVDRSHVVLGSVVAASGVSDPDELQLALNTFRHLRPALQAHGNDPKLARRACSMYAAAVTHGIADKRDFLAAAALYGVLREDGITSAGELRLAVAMYTAVREEGILDPDDLHTAIALATIARDEGLSDPRELSRLLQTTRGAMPQHYAANGSPSPTHLGGLRAMGGLEAAEGTAAAALQQQVLTLHAQLEQEKTARSKYARQLEQQAVEWMSQVKLLKEYIDSLRAKMPQASAAGMPNLKMPSGLQGMSSNAGSERRGSDPAVLLSGLESDWASKAPLFEDDASFIREVVDGEVLAPDMAVQMELDRLRQKYEAWSKQFKQRMRDVQASLRQQGRPGPNSTNPMPYSGGGGHVLVDQYSADTGVPGVQSMVGHSGGDMVAVHKPPVPHQQQHRPHHIVHAHAAMPAGPDAAVTVAGPAVHKPYRAAQVDVRKMPDLNAPDLLGGDNRGSENGSDGGRRKKGVFSRVFG